MKLKTEIKPTLLINKVIFKNSFVFKIPDNIVRTINRILI
jgi:hypothetical protein